ncbi:serine hydrolase domain-containing protein [Microbacterium imperiale]|uniref:Carboxylesterase n=1 Tax=Microbacterium imperiale TaxID=33884 RepID=A0A9W6M3A0_9MICO|nr:serine hydrolase domain-containing protein [Microbacterium imperiale]MBP2420703.1 CubicO group peptidase (beta-lactamase class C family) [Microbacterium imperiale]MDS0200524.1 beta-lactamase family protein [Microbacterium imperiale]BFE41043.1 serine hydrolase domain-containing protein [Microbacterium imperiale]GLJ79577.1 carboxylesterase [Microbacterium imperiale]
MTSDPTIAFHRDVRDARLSEAATVFEELLTSGREVGGAFAVLQHGRVLAHCWGGTSRDDDASPWREDTLVQVYSAGKPLVALAAMLAVRDGFVSLDDPVTRTWPHYVDHDDDPTTLRSILSHTSGKHRFPDDTATLDPSDTAALTDALATSPPLAPPGSLLFEHAATYGHLVDGLLAAAAAPSVAERSAQLSELLSAEFHFGMPDDQHHRIADLRIIDEGWLRDYNARPTAKASLSLPPGLLDPAYTRSARWRRTSFGAVGLMTDALSLATFYDDIHRPDGAVAGSLGPSLHRQMLSPAASGFDEFLQQDVEWGLGLRLDDGEIGMGGIGGSAAWHSIGADYSMAYVTRGLADHSRVDAVAEAVERALDPLGS